MSENVSANEFGTLTALLPEELAPARRVELPGRGTTFVRDLPGPPGAPTVVLIHGLLATADLNWSGSYAPLTQHFRVIALDLRGHGRGIRSRGRFRLEDCADDVAAVADVLDLPTFVPVGYSMGGTIAQLVWRRHRDRVEGLVLCATSHNFRGRFRFRGLFEFQVVLAANLVERLTPPPVRLWLAEQLLGRRVKGSQDEWKWAEFRRNSPVKMIEAAQAMGRYTSQDWIGEVDVPTAVVVTRHDRLVRPERQRKLAAAVPDAAVYELDGDHPVGVREPHRFVPVLIDACLDVSRRVRGSAHVGATPVAARRAHQ